MSDYSRITRKEKEQAVETLKNERYVLLHSVPTFKALRIRNLIKAYDLAIDALLTEMLYEEWEDDGK